MRTPALLLAIGVCVACGTAAPAQAPLVSNLEPTRTLEAQSITDDRGRPANDISGIACMPGSGNARVCLLVNDEDRFAQFARLEGSRLIGGRKHPLIGEEPSSATIGRAPQGAACSEGEGRFKELDGEGVAYARPHFYIAGSHGCSRNSMKFRTSSFILARVEVDAQGIPLQPMAETTYRLSDVLKSAPEVGAFFGKDLTEDNGLNIEGIAVVDGRLIAGLRAPVLRGRAFLVSASVAHLFSRDRSPPPADVRVTPVALGPDVGIRDLALLADGRLLLLAGPAQEQRNVPGSLFLVEPATGTAKQLATLKEQVEGRDRGKAEAVAVLEESADALQVLVLFDSLPGGGPREYRVPLR